MTLRTHMSAQLVALASLTTALVPAQVAVAADPVAVERMNVTSEGGQSRGSARWPAISSDGQTVIFASATDLSSASGSTSLGGPYGRPIEQVYARDRATGRTEAVSVSNAGIAATCGVQGQHDLDADGSTVVFTSKSTSLVAASGGGDCFTYIFDQYGQRRIPSQTEIYVRDRAAGTTEVVSVGLGGSVANGQSDAPRISDDGRLVVFMSDASNLVANDTNGRSDIFVRDLTTRTTKVISVDAAGIARGGSSPAMSADGNWVMFGSNSRELDPLAPQTELNIFLHDLRSGTTSHLALPTVDGEPVTRESGGVSLSGDGSKVAFSSYAHNLVADDTLGTDLFVHDRATRTTTMVNRNASGAKPSNLNGGLEIADDGSAVSFVGDGQLIGDERPDMYHLYVRDLVTGRLQIASLNAVGVEAAAQAGSRVLNADATLAAFSSGSSDLVAGDTNGVEDVFVRDLTVPVTARPGTINATLDGSGNPLNSTGGAATPLVPVQTTVVGPVGLTGVLTAAPQSIMSAAPAGYSFFGSQVVLEGPASTFDKPYTVTFTVDSSVLDGIAPADVQVFRDGAPLTGCTAPLAAVPDPCVVSRGFAGEGDAAVVVRTSHFSTWSLGRLVYDLSGPLAPVDAAPIVNTAKAGAAIPIRFKLGGDRGLDVISAGYPKAVASSCAGSADEIEQVVSAGASGLSYDASSSTYIYTWKTAKTPGCRNLVLRMRDGSELTAKFHLR